MADITCAKVHRGALAFASGALLYVWQPSGEVWRSSHHTAPIRAIACTGEHWVSTGDDKRILFHTLAKDLTVQQEILHHKKVSSLDFLAGQLVYGDKFGEVWSIDTAKLTSGPACDQPCVSFAMGHQSSILSVQLAEGRLLTIDIEQKLKVSSFPAMHQLQAVLMGHTAMICSGVMDQDTVFSLDVEGRVIRWRDLEVAAEARVQGALRLFVARDSLLCVCNSQISQLSKDTLQLKKEIPLHGSPAWISVADNTVYLISSEGQVTHHDLSTLAAD